MLTPTIPPKQGARWGSEKPPKPGRGHKDGARSAPAAGGGAPAVLQAPHRAAPVSGTFVALQHVLVGLDELLLLAAVGREQPRHVAGHGGPLCRRTRCSCRRGGQGRSEHRPLPPAPPPDRRPRPPPGNTPTTPRPSAIRHVPSAVATPPGTRPGGPGATPGGGVGQPRAGTAGGDSGRWHRQAGPPSAVTAAWRRAASKRFPVATSAPQCVPASAGRCSPAHPSAAR